MISIIFIALLGYLVSSQIVENVTYPVINKTLMINASIVQSYQFTANVKDLSMLTVKSNPAADILLCFQEQYLFSSPVFSNNSDYWSAPHSVCSIVVEAPTGTVDTSLPLLNVPYVVTVGFKNVSAVNGTVQITFSLGTPGDSCAQGQVPINAVTCATPSHTISVNSTVQHMEDVPIGDSVYRIHFDSPEIVSQLMISCVANSSAKYNIRLRRDGTPLINQNNPLDRNNLQLLTCPGASSIVIQNPRNGLNGYNLLMTNPELEKANFTLHATVCPPGFGGLNCLTNFSNTSAVTHWFLNETNTYYFQVHAIPSDNNSVWASVRRVLRVNQAIIPNPRIFASMNQLPTADNADVLGCTQTYCDYVNTIRFSVVQNQTWYVGVQNNNMTENHTQAGIWFNSICAPSCEEHGTCNDDGPEVGYCNCIEGFIGVDCTIQDGFGPQFIVLIIIAVLVALTAIIGFAAWAYMRRKRDQYSAV